MKIEFLKQHLENKQGDTVDVHEDLANYLIAVGAAKEAKDKPKEKKQLSDNPGATKKK